MKTIPTFDILTSQSQIVDPWATNTLSPYYYGLVSFSVQSSTNLVDWRTEMQFTNWISLASFCSIAYTNGVPIATNKVAAGSQNNMVLQAGADDSRVKFFRITE